MDQPKIPIEALEGLMKKAFIDWAVEPGLFWDALLNSHLFLPLSQKHSEEISKTGDLSEIPILMGKDSENKDVLWLFTSPAVMIDYTEKSLPYLEMESLKVFKHLLETSREVVLIGPERLTLRLDPKFIDSLAQGKVPEPPEKNIRYIPKNTNVFVGVPQDDTAALESRFKELFEHADDVLEAQFIQVADDNGSRLLLGLRLKDESKEAFTVIAQQVARASEGILEKGKMMDVTLMNGSLKGAFSKYGRPFYLK